MENLSIPTINPFVIHEDLQIIVQQWLFDVLVYLVYLAGGWAGIYLYSISMFLLAIFCLYKYFSLFTENNDLKVICLCVWGVIQTVFATSRPTSITFVVLTVWLIIMEKYKRTGNKKLLGWLPLLSILEVNVHSSLWPFIFILSLPYLIPDKLTDFSLSSLKEKKELFIILFISLLCGLINPYGWRGAAYLFLSTGTLSNFTMIEELQSPTVLSMFGLFIIISVIILVLYLSKEKKNVSLQKVSMSAGTILLASMNIRNAWFLIFGMVPIISEIGEEFRLKFSFKQVTVVITVCLEVILLVICPFSIYDSETMPVLAADYLDEIAEEDIVLYTDFNIGAYMEWRGYQVYIDARPELFYTKINKKYDVADEYLAVYDGSIDYENFIKKYGFSYLICRENSKLDIYLRGSDNFEVVVSGNGYFLYEQQK